MVDVVEIATNALAVYCLPCALAFRFGHPDQLIESSNQSNHLQVCGTASVVAPNCTAQIAAAAAMYAGEVATLTEKVRALADWKAANEHFEDLFKHEASSCISDIGDLRGQIIELTGMSAEFTLKYNDLDAENKRLWWGVLILLVFIAFVMMQEPLRKTGVRVRAWGNKTNTWCTGTAGHITLSVCGASQWAVNGVNRCANAIVYCVTSVANAIVYCVTTVANALVYAVFWGVSNSLLCFNTGIARLSTFCFWAKGKCKQIAALMFTNMIVQLVVYMCRDYIIGGEDITFPTDYIGIIRMDMAGGIYDSVVAVMLNPKMVAACMKTALNMAEYFGF